MRDPWPFPPPPWLVNATKGFSNGLALPVLNLHIHEVLISAIVYHVMCTYVSPRLSRFVFPVSYAKLTHRSRLNWDIHVTSLFQSVMISALGVYHLIYNQERKAMDWRDRVWAYDGGLALIVSLATGYFVWDLAISIYYIKDFGIGMFAHAASALSVYAFGFRPIVNYYAPVFIVFELSTPFLNVHWFFDKLEMTGSNPQLYNGIVLMATFFGARLVWGSYSGFCVFPDMLKALKYQDTVEGRAWLAQGVASNAVDAAASAASGDTHLAVLKTHTAPKYVPFWVAAVYLGSYVILMVLNVHWFGKMISTIRSRFDPPFGTRKVKPEKQVIMGRGIDSDGVKSVEVDSREVRQRRSRKA